jgi:ribonuclease P protein component
VSGSCRSRVGTILSQHTASSAVSRRGGSREAHLPTEQPPSSPQARLPRPYEHPRRPRRAQVAPCQGPPQALGLIWRIRERDVFARLTHDGRRARAGVLWCTFLPDPSASPPRVAFAIGRAIGSSVVRNRVRRQLRAVLSNLTSTATSTPLPPGFYLVGARPGIVDRSFAQLTREAIELVSAVQRQAARPSTSAAGLTPSSPVS